MTGRYKNQGEVEVEYNGQKYSGHWELEKSVLTVESFGLGREVTQLGNEQPWELAKRLLLELIVKKTR